MLPGAPNGRISVIVVIGYLVGAAGLSYIIAGLAELMTTLAAGNGGGETI